MKGPGQDLYTPITNSNNAKDVTVCVGLVISGRLDSEKLLRGAFDLVAKWPLLGGSIVQNVRVYREAWPPSTQWMLMWKTSPWSFATGNKVDFRSRTVDKAVHEIFGVPFWEKSPAGLSYIHQATDSRAVDKLFHFDNYRAYDARIDGMVSIRATTLEDATLLGFRCSHYLVNAATLCEIIQAYCDILADRPIPELVWPPDSQPNQPLSDLVAIDGRDSKARHDPIPEDNLVTWADFNRIGAWAALPMLWTTIVTVLLSWLLKSYALEERFMYIPAITVEKMRAEAQRKVKGFARLSRLDVISAWFLKVIQTTLDIMWQWCWYRWRRQRSQAVLQTAMYLRARTQLVIGRHSLPRDPAATGWRTQPTRYLSAGKDSPSSRQVTLQTLQLAYDWKFLPAKILRL